MGTPANPKQYDVVTLIDADGTEREFMIFYVDDDIVALQSFSRCATFTRDEFAKLFEEVGE